VAGYSGTPLPKKLGIEEGHRVALLRPPDGLHKSLRPLPDGVATDLDQAVVMEVGLAAGLVDNKVCAIDETWSGLRFVVRLKDR
jgi:hypothetical protein